MYVRRMMGVAGEMVRQAQVLQQAPLQEGCSRRAPAPTLPVRSTPPAPNRTASGTSRSAPLLTALSLHLGSQSLCCCLGSDLTEPYNTSSNAIFAWAWPDRPLLADRFLFDRTAATVHELTLSNTCPIFYTPASCNLTHSYRSSPVPPISCTPALPL